MRGHAEALPQKTPPYRNGSDPSRSHRVPRPKLDGATSGPPVASRDRLAHRIALVLLVLAALYRLTLVLHGWPSLDSDEAIVGLMARHILHNGEFPNFFWGQLYLGTLQAYFAAALFAVFGSSLVALRLPVLLLTLGLLAAVYLLGRAAFGRAAGLVTLAWLALGPPYPLIREIVAVGGHQEMLLCAALLLLGVWYRLRQPLAPTRDAQAPEATPPRRSAIRLPGTGRLLAYYAGLGIVAGLGFWSDPLILPVLLATAVALLFGRTREILSRYGLIFVLGFVLGALPFLVFNVTNHGASFTQIVTQRSLPGQSRGLPSLASWQSQIGETLAVALPVTLGSPHVCVTQGAIWDWYPSALVQATPTAGICQAANILFSLGALALYLAAAWPALLVLRRWSRTLPDRLQSLRTSRFRAAPQSSWRARLGSRHSPRAASSDPRSSPPSSSSVSSVVHSDSATLWLRGMLLFIALFTLAAYASGADAQQNQFTAARYLIPLYLTVPLLFGALWTWAAPLLVPLARIASRSLSLTGTARLPVRESRRLPGTGRGFTRRPSRRDSSPLSCARSASSMSSVVKYLSSALLVLLLALALIESAVTLAYASHPSRFGLPTTRADARLITFLDAHHIRAFYTDYWTCYRLAFESDERLLCSVRGQYGEPQLNVMNNRYHAYEVAMARVPYPAYILPVGSSVDHDFAAIATSAGLPHAGYLRTALDGYAIYWHPS
jgi:hypothetical protein